MSEIKNILSNLSVFTKLNDDELSLVIEKSKELRYSSGDMIFEEGDPGGNLYVVLQGAIEISTLVMEDFEKSLVTLREGSLFGEVSLIDKNPREVKARAVEDSLLLSLERDDFDALMEHNPELGAKVLRVLVQTVVKRVRMTTEQYRRNTQWGLSVSGALNLNWNHLIQDEVDIKLDYMNGESVQGTLLKVEKGDHGLELLVGDSNKNVFIVPYHAIRTISFERPDIMAAKAGDD